VCWEKETGVRGRRAVPKGNKARSWVRLASPRRFFSAPPIFLASKKWVEKAGRSKSVKSSAKKDISIDEFA